MFTLFTVIDLGFKIKAFFWCSGYWWTVFAQYQGFFSFLFLCSSCSQQDGRGQEDGQNSLPKLCKGLFLAVWCHAQQQKRVELQEVFACGSVFPRSCCLALAAHWTACEICDWLLLQQQGFLPSSLPKLSWTWPTGLATFVLPVLSLVLLGVLVSQAAPWALSWGQPTTTLSTNRQEPPIYFCSFLTMSPGNKETYL